MFIPTMKSTYAAAAVITFMNAWNSYLWPKVIMTDNKAMTMPMLIANLITGYVTDYGMLMCGVLFCSIPTMIVFFVSTETVCRRYYHGRMEAHSDHITYANVEEASAGETSYRYSLNGI